MLAAEQWYVSSRRRSNIKDLITYKVLSRYPFEIQECGLGTGQACGAVRLDEGFEALVKRKLGRHSATILTPKRILEFKRQFDSFIKRQFDPFDEDCEEEYEVNLAGAPDIPEVGLEAGYLKIKKHVTCFQNSNMKRRH
jgi:hypothetical protein